MSYTENGGGCCNGGGFSMPFIFPFMAGNGGFGNGNSNGWGGAFGFEALMMLFFFSLFGFGGWGGGWGGMRGGFPGMMPGMSPACGLNAVGGNIAAEAAAYVGQQQVADRVAGIATGVDAVAGLVSAQGVKLETVKDAVTNGFFASQTNLCELGNNIAQQFNAQTLQGINNHNNLTSQLTDMRFSAQQCCCDTKQLIQSGLCDLRHTMDSYKCDTDSKIAASTAAILAQLNADKFERMQEKLAKANAIIATQKAEADNQKQTAQLAALIQQQGRGCAPCAPCAPYAGCSPCGNPCLDGLTKAVSDAFGTRIGEILFPPTTTAA